VTQVTFFVSAIGKKQYQKILLFTYGGDDRIRTSEGFNSLPL
jgi:hypothetical protein